MLARARGVPEWVSVFNIPANGTGSEKWERKWGVRVVVVVDVRRLESVHMPGWCRASRNHAGPSHTKMKDVREYMGRGQGEKTPYMFLDEFQHSCLDGTIELRALARCAWVWRERVDEVRETVQNEHRTVPLGDGSGLSPKSRVLLPSRSNAHPHTRINKCVQRALNSRAILRAAHFAIAIAVNDGFGFRFCCVQSDDSA